MVFCFFVWHVCTCSPNEALILVLFCIGVNLGIRALHPLTGQPVPVFAADYVVSEYGTKAVMGVPGHDLRDELFAEQNHLPITITAEDSTESGEKILCNSDKVRSNQNILSNNQFFV